MGKNPLSSLLGRAAALGIAGSAAVYGINTLKGPGHIKEVEDPGSIINSFTTIIPPDYAKSLQTMESMKAGLPDTVAFLASDSKGNILAMDKVSGDAFTYDINNSRILGKLKLDSTARRRFGRFLNQREQTINEALPVYKTSEFDMASDDYLNTLRKLYPAEYSDIPDVRPDIVGNIIYSTAEDEAARLRKAYKLAVGFGGLALFGLGVAEGPKLRGLNPDKIKALIQGVRTGTGRAIDILRPRADKLMQTVQHQII